MNTLSYIKEVRPYYRNKLWLSARTGILDKLNFYPAVIMSYARMLTHKKYINYLGTRFYFDNPATPLNIMVYPYDIDRRIIELVSTPISYVLDIGGNLGQFSKTLSYFTELKRLDVFEPNPNIVKTLASNLSHLGKKVRIYNYGLSSSNQSSGQLYFEPGRSATGSLLENNAGLIKNLEKTKIKLTNKPASLTKRTKYDLIKIDVEGHEIESIKGLRGVSTKYLFIEVSSSMRERSYTDSELLAAIRRVLGEYQLLYISGYNSDSQLYEMLIEF